MPDFNKMVADMMADLRAENARLVSALRQKEEEIRRSEEALTRLAADLNDLKARVRALAADCKGPKLSDLSPVLDILRGLSIADFTPPKKPPVARSPNDVVPGWVYRDSDTDPENTDLVYVPEMGEMIFIDERPSNQWPIEHGDCFPWTPIRYIGSGLIPAQAKEICARAR